MATSETLLSVVAIRLAALVVAGLVARTAAANHQGSDVACVHARMTIEVQAPPAAKPAADDGLLDMLRHD